uniref:C2H2-type domain-containing protein n=1 Tax=Wuchereria bancrofti TaxID=6293 RepID=A0AAF5PS71_WUCBA
MEGLQAVFDYLKREPVMYNALQRFVNETIQHERSLITFLGVVQTKLDELERRYVQGEMEEDAVSQEPTFDEDEAESAPLPENDDEAENWPYEAEWAPLPEEDNENEGPEISVASMEMSGIEERVESVRELVLRTRTIEIPILTTQQVLAAATPEQFRPADLGDLPVQLRRELQVPQAVPYTVLQEEGIISIVCGICNRQFETLKGWRIHASRMHKQDGFCARCGHNLLLPPGFTAAQRKAAVELHALDWCPRACAAVMSERRVKRRRLDLVGREEDAHHLFVPGQ